MRKIEIEKLTVQSFAPFGQAILGASGTPQYQGDGWQCRFPDGDTHLPDGKIGWVTVQPLTEKVVIGMERESEVEMIWPVDQPIIQAVAAPKNLEDHTAQPEADQVRAFLISPGQVIIMHRGTWHYAAFAAGETPSLYYFITSPRPPAWQKETWVPFQNKETIIVAHR